MLNVIETETENPICPHCGNELKSVFAKRIESILGVRFIYFCSFCKKVLGVSHRKGFWMG
jgi:hypothetical protein